MVLFVEDLRRATRVVLGVRWLLPVVVLVGLVAAGITALGRTPAGAVLAVAGPVWLVVWLGWLGTQRVVVARASRGEELDARNVWAGVRILGPRFVRLGLLLLPVGALLVLAAGTWGVTTVRYRLLLGVVVLVAYGALTFVTPALVFTTPRVRDAVVVGWRLLRNTWRETWAHAVVPAVVFAGVYAGAVGGMGGALAGVVVVELVALLVRGATALRYVDLVDVAWRDVPGGVWRRRVRVGSSGST